MIPIFCVKPDDTFFLLKLKGGPCLLSIKIIMCLHLSNQNLNQVELPPELEQLIKDGHV
jgi:hypothetical protein